MNKKELVSEIATRSNLTNGDAQKALEATIDAIKDAVRNGDKVSLVGFATFEKQDKPAGVARNPSTGAEIPVPAHSKLKISASKAIHKELFPVAA